MEKWEIKECWCKHIYVDLTQIANVEIVRWGREEAWEVFNDADILLKYLTDYK